MVTHVQTNQYSSNSRKQSASLKCKATGRPPATLIQTAGTSGLTTVHSKPGGGDCGECGDHSATNNGSAAHVNLTRIVVSDRPLRDISAEAAKEIAAHNQPRVLFKRNGRVARITPLRDGQPTIELVTSSMLRYHLARAADYVKTDRDGATHVPPPWEVVQDLLADQNLALPTLTGIVRAPTIRADGSILDAPGYDERTGLYHVPTPGLVVPMVSPNPAASEVKRALQLIDDAIGEFPFDSVASRTNYRALLLTLCTRQVVVGPTPLCLIDKPQPGTGATLLCDVTSRIVLGHPLQTTSPAASDAEWRKRITAALLAGKDLIIIDNLETKLVSAALAAAITSRIWSDRPLGRTAIITVPQRAVWVVTGNNIQVAPDLLRRSFHVRLDAKSDRPWLRSGFHHSNLSEWVVGHRGELLWALLTICRSWFAAGRPAFNGMVLGGFEDWTATIGGILEHAGLQEFLANRESLYAGVDEDTTNWTCLFEQWHKAFGDTPVTVKALLAKAMDGTDLHEAIAAIAGAINFTDTRGAQQVGIFLRSQRDAVHGHYRLERGADDSHTKVACWQVVAVPSAPLKGEND